MVVDFKDLCEKASAGVQVLISNVDCFAWKDYGDKGNPCYVPYAFDTKLEREEDALI